MHVSLKTLFVAGGLSVLSAAYGADSALVRTEGGLVQGSSDAKVTVYKGVPFAAPPVGDLRWRPPQPTQPWSNVLQANAFKPMCMTTQAAVPGGPMEQVSEDCLYLNIWTPAQSGGAKRPVMVWIYGGGMRAGSASSPVYWGDKLAGKGVVVVNLSYRAGSFGFLAHPDLSRESGYGASGNYGILDMIAALKWVQRNIAAFGGDPQNVTIFGQSAGSYGVGYLMTSPLARGLFHRAIGQSGADMNPVGEGMMLLASAEAAGARFATELGARSIAELRRLPAERILAVDAKWPSDGQGNVKGGTVAVQDGHVFPAAMYDIFKAGKQNDVPILIGYNENEGSTFLQKPAAAPAYVESVKAQYGPLADRVLRLYPATPEEIAAESQRRLLRDNWYGWHVWTWARLQSTTGRGKVYFYRFSHVVTSPPGSVFARLGAAHGFELPYVFGHFEQFPPTASASDERVVETLSTYWTNFAKSGDPNGSGLPQWPAFTAREQRLMNLGSRIVAQHLAEADLQALELQDAARNPGNGNHQVIDPAR